MTYISIKNDKIVGVSDSFFKSKDSVIKLRESVDPAKVLGKRIKKNNKIKRIAILCNYGDNCGIATYSNFLIEAFKNIQEVEVKIFSEFNEKSDKINDIQCWKRGESMVPAINIIKEWGPDFILIQHEFGIFPKATHFLKMLELINDIPYAVVLHSTYEHLDKTICTSAIKNIIVHTEDAKNILLKLGNKSNIYVIPHGCVLFEDFKELWNIFQTPYCIFQFGFGFSYKGVDIAIEAISYLKKIDVKFKDIFYCYLCSENDRCKNIHEDYYEKLKNKIESLKLEDNVAVLRGFHDEKTINNFLRTAKLAIFPYINNPDNVVYGASGAVRIAMANNIPVIASKSHLFDDLEGVVPRIENSLELAKEIDNIFSDYKYKNSILEKCKKFVNENNWSIVADKYLTTFKEIERTLDFVDFDA